MIYLQQQQQKSHNLLQVVVAWCRVSITNGSEYKKNFTAYAIVIKMKEGKKLKIVREGMNEQTGIDVLGCIIDI